VGELLWEAIAMSAEVSAARPSEVIVSAAQGAPRMVTELLQRVGQASPREIAARLRWSRSKTLRVITAMAKAGDVERDGCTRATTYRLMPPGNWKG
jgi:hypothetical protein